MTTGKRCGVWRKNENNRRNEILSGGKKKLQTGKGRKTVGRTDEMVPGCEVWHVYSLRSIFDARKRGMGADE